jgi:hypothetical protein
MIRSLSLAGLLLLAPSLVHAEDFTGFYAGVNAGYGWGHEGTKGGTRLGPPRTDLRSGSADGLPPSASAAATAMGRATASRAAPAR